MDSLPFVCHRPVRVSECAGKPETRFVSVRSGAFRLRLPMMVQADEGVPQRMNPLIVPVSALSGGNGI
jgi:hypothetical protein